LVSSSEQLQHEFAQGQAMTRMAAQITTIAPNPPANTPEKDAKDPEKAPK
jgi:phospholipid/cholesterol/gamma-HCH transport system substrate-binding protein